ncbi:GNAT family N-acetyltransferase [Ignavigranum ruoffiae]|uniref:Riboflavin biosynthesis RibT protein n=1 Tax=Ignavigranum ruoffiae TaxID=89093 RepID=A0A1H8ZM67_9LACT|nr:GNAT family N-acetyltransferase [Ignavigranum ruoffiae]SEP65313.1 riboflavin biosynthesis RibT protein [Ignavigranum ruoffiae]
MLINSTDKNDKIVIGLLSYTYSEDVPSIDQIKKLIEEYRANPDQHIFLYKEDDGDNYIGLIAVGMSRSEDQADSNLTINVQRVAVVPSFRNEGVGYRMFESLKDRYPNSPIIGTMDNVDLVLKWTNQYNQKH